MQAYSPHPGIAVLKPLFKYADFNGRANRAEYWMFWLLQLVVYIGILFFSVALAVSGSPAAAIGTGLLLFCGVALGCFIPNLAVTVRRLHDSNRSAWWLLLYVPSFFASFMVIGNIASLSPSNPDALANLAAAAPHLSVVSLIGDLCQLVFFAYLVWPGTRGPNRFGDDPTGRGGIDLTVFDAPVDMAPEEAKPPHKPIFDFTSPEPAPAAQPAPVPAPIQPVMPAASPVRQTPTFGKRR